MADDTSPPDWKALLEGSAGPAARAADVRRALQAMRPLEVPWERRAAVWAALLEVDERADDPREAAALQAVALDLENQRVVRVDVERTRPRLRAFRSEAVRAQLSRMLTRFCKARGVSYKQGLNEVLAPFVAVALARAGALAPSEDEAEGVGGAADAAADDPLADMIALTPREEAACFAAFGAFASRFCPFFEDDEFVAMQCALALLRLLLLYHAPALCHRLDQCVHALARGRCARRRTGPRGGETG